MLTSRDKVSFHGTLRVDLVAIHVPVVGDNESVDLTVEPTQQ